MTILQDRIKEKYQMFVVFKVIQADPSTFVPSVTDYKVAFLQSIEQVGDKVLVRLKLRDDFESLDQEEEEFLKLQSSGETIDGQVTGYHGNGVYV